MEQGFYQPSRVIRTESTGKAMFVATPTEKIIHVQLPADEDLCTWRDADMIDFVNATSSTRHPFYFSYKNFVRNALGNFTPEQLMDWYKNELKNK